MKTFDTFAILTPCVCQYNSPLARLQRWIHAHDYILIYFSQLYEKSAGILSKGNLCRYLRIAVIGALHPLHFTRPHRRYLFRARSESQRETSVIRTLFTILIFYSSWLRHSHFCQGFDKDYPRSCETKFKH